MKLLGAKASVLNTIFINNTPFAVYVNNNFITHNFAQEIRKHCGKKEALKYMINKYGWLTKILNSIEWNLHSVFIRKHSYSKKNANEVLPPLT